jgi:mannosyltransferase PIG-V
VAVSAPEARQDGFTASVWGLSSAGRRALSRVLVAFLLTRLILYITAAIAIRLLPSHPGTRAAAHLGKNLSLAAWARWDAGWYLSIAERGYWFDPKGASSVAFFPLLPLSMKGLGTLTGNYAAAGLLIANLAALGAVLALWRWVRAEAGLAAAERATLWLLVYPFSFYFHSIYAESLFFLLVTLTFHASAQGQRLAAGIWAGLAAATRPMGALLTPALAWGLWRDWRAGRPARGRDAIAVLLPVAGLGAYMAYLWAAFGDPLVFWKAHVVGWHVQLQWTEAMYWRETLETLIRPTRMRSYTDLLQLIRVLLPVVFVALTVQVFRRLGAVPGIYTALSVVVAVGFAPQSVGREFLAAVPAFAVLGLVGPRGMLGETLRLCSLGLLIVFVFAFVTGHFVG